MVEGCYNIMGFGIGICNGVGCERRWSVFNGLCVDG